jgi:UDP-glucose 4-epimerase
VNTATASSLIASCRACAGVSMRWLITGGCGFIGRNLLLRLLRDSNASCRVVDDLSVGTREELGEIVEFAELTPGDSAMQWADWARSRVELVVADIRDPAVARKVPAGGDVVAHLAANTGVAPSVEDPMRDCTMNVSGTLNYLEACRSNGVRRFVFASSGAPLGDCTPPIHEELAPHPVSPYGASKLAGEAYCSAYAHSFGVEAVALRFGNCYGPLSNHKSSVVAKFIREAFAGKRWEIYGDGNQTRDFIYVEDVANAIVLGASADAVAGEVFQIATNSETTVLELATRVADVLKSYGISPPAIQHAKPRIGDVKRNYSDTTKARARLGWRPLISLNQGLDRTVKWFIEAAPRPNE